MEDIREGLEEAGLSSYQAEAYSVLLEQGVLPAVDVARESSIPSSRIYDVLADLEQQGYVETFEREDKRHVRAVEPSEIVDGLRERSERLSDTAERIEEVWEQSSLLEHRIALLARDESVISQAEQLVRSAETSVDLAVTTSQYYRLREALAEARENGAVVRVSVEGLNGEAIDTDQPVTEIRDRGIPGPFVTIVDRTHTCFSPNERAPTTYGLVLDDSILSFVFHWYFQTCLWATCQPLYRRPDTERTYVSVEEFVRDAYPLWWAGAIVPVTVVGTDTDTGERRELSGVLTNVVYPGMDLRSDRPPTYGELAGMVTLRVEDGEDAYSVGGWGAIFEDVEAEKITFHTEQVVLPP
ncbi:MAG: TrmB family transcriptional regulator [Haloarculaceae archaeon]